ncbi:MAG: hypothetical protein KatS3mg022_0176 [Armatimonadota bacterium]|nr:MAG: hypothetical protein KatS3mg022_0176 [Armatimonadota bacterium]
MKTMVLRKIGTKALEPPLFFPSGTEVIGVEILADKNQGKIEYDVGYVAVVPARREDVERFYQQRYRNEKVRWYHPRTGETKSVAVVFSRSGGKTKQGVVTLLFSDGVRGETTSKYTSRRQGRWTSIYALVQAEELRAQLDALVKDRAGHLVTFSIYMPQIEQEQ